MPLISFETQTLRPSGVTATPLGPSSTPTVATTVRRWIDPPGVRVSVVYDPDRPRGDSDPTGLLPTLIGVTLPERGSSRESTRLPSPSPYSAVSDGERVCTGFDRDRLTAAPVLGSIRWIDWSIEFATQTPPARRRPARAASDRALVRPPGRRSSAGRFARPCRRGCWRPRRTRPRRRPRTGRVRPGSSAGRCSSSDRSSTPSPGLGIAPRSILRRRRLHRARPRAAADPAIELVAASTAVTAFAPSGRGGMRASRAAAQTRTPESRPPPRSPDQSRRQHRTAAEHGAFDAFRATQRRELETAALRRQAARSAQDGRRPSTDKDQGRAGRARRAGRPRPASRVDVREQHLPSVRGGADPGGRCTENPT